MTSTSVNISYFMNFIVDYVVMITLCFLILPFTYFYAEEALDSEEDFMLNYGSGDDEEDTPYSPKK